MRIERRSITRHRREEGFAIIIVLWILMILSTLTLTFASRAKIDLKMVKFQQDAARADAIAKVGYRQALILLREDALKDQNVEIREEIVDFDDDDRFVYDGGNEAWAYYPKLYDNVEYAGGHYTVTVRDETAKFPINNQQVSVDMLFALMTKVAYEDEDQAWALAGALKDWMDGDTDPADVGEDRELGDRDTEMTYYNPRQRRNRRREEQQPVIFVPKNANFSSREELLLVWGITPSLYFGEDANHNGRTDPNERDGNKSWPPDDGDRFASPGIKNFITTYGKRCNLNTAPYEVLYALLYPILGEDADKMASEIAEYRDGSDKTQYTDDDRVMRTRDDSDGDDMHFDKAADLDPQVINSLLQSTCTIASGYFEITVLAEYKDIQRGLHAIVRRQFIEEDQLPYFGEETDVPEDMEQVVLTTVEFETLEDAQDLYFGQSSKKRSRGTRRRR